MAKIYALSPQRYSQEVIATAFAKTSRTPDSFQSNADELNAAQAARFQEKWVLGFGHSSVAEHAVLHIAVEDISRLATEELESCRLASYTEKSSRYQVFDRDHYFIPPEITGTTIEPVYHSTIGALLDIYQTALNPFRAIITARHPRGEDESQTAYDARIRTKVMDSARYSLPQAMLTNVGMTINARALEHTIVKLLSSDLPESRMIGEEIKRVSLAEVPTLVKYAERETKIKDIVKEFEFYDSGEAGSSLKFYPSVLFDKQVLFREHNVINKIMRALMLSNSIAPQSDINYEAAITGIDAKQEYIRDIVNAIGPRQSLPREFEHINFSFVITLDQGAYYDLKRHRMMTQTVQPLHPFAYSMPRLFQDAGLSEAFHATMKRVLSAYQSISTLSPALAPYVVPNAFHRRVFVTMNYREMYNVVRLRSGKNGHPAYRVVALAIKEAMQGQYPFLGGLLVAGDERTSAEVWGEFAEGSYFA